MSHLWIFLSLLAVPSSGVADAAAGCIDTNPGACPGWNAGGQCKLKAVKTQCRKTCGECGAVTTTSLTSRALADEGCIDTNPGACPGWSEGGQCVLDAVKTQCRKTCGECGATSTAKRTTTTTTTTTKRTTTSTAKRTTTTTTTTRMRTTTTTTTTTKRTTPTTSTTSASTTEQITSTTSASTTESDDDDGAKLNMKKGWTSTADCQGEPPLTCAKMWSGRMLCTLDAPMGQNPSLYRSNSNNNWNDIVKMFWVQEGCQLTVYESDQYRGKFERFAPGQHDLRGNFNWEDQISSYKCACSAAPTTSAGRPKTESPVAPTKTSTRRPTTVSTTTTTSTTTRASAPTQAPTTVPTLAPTSSTVGGAPGPSPTTTKTDAAGSTAETNKKVGNVSCTSDNDCANNRNHKIICGTGATKKCISGAASQMLLLAVYPERKLHWDILVCIIVIWFLIVALCVYIGRLLRRNYAREDKPNTRVQFKESGTRTLHRSKSTSHPVPRLRLKSKGTRSLGRIE